MEIRIRNERDAAEESYPGLLLQVCSVDVVAVQAEMIPLHDPDEALSSSTECELRIKNLTDPPPPIPIYVESCCRTLA